ncbi:histidine kinase [Antarcticibacterium arcticum]|uniref:Histidine kinase n=1 Tax=Antarcticibacterium arcticum TaxID=2585771 RepID=A0A5B8YJF9_9FLAO|nr:histidine kinase [Antarcticibacterium arcticum]QED37894.1 histidine kinase [Antarcticibacterium arcticum]
MRIILPFVLILLLLQFKISFSQELTQPIQNFSSVQYGAASQNWDVVIDSRGIIYSANNEGLLSFDGQKWELHPLPSGAIVRSVYAHQERVYTGSYQEFGYWARNRKGELKYTSLMPLLKDYEMHNEEIWDILSFQGSIYFRSFGALYKYDQEKIIPVKNLVLNSMQVFNGKLILAIGKQGIFSLEENGELSPLPKQEILKGKTVIELEKDGKDLLIGTRNALYKFDGETFSLYEDSNLNGLLERYELNHILRISDVELVFATVKNGIIQYNKNLKNSRIYNRNSGLQNNTVLGMAVRNGKIWLGLDNGIDAINLSSPVNFYTDDTGELGAVYDVAFHNSQIYLASNTGVYQLNNNGLSLIEGAEGHSWNLEIINNQLYSNHNTGTYRIENLKFIPVESRTGSFDIIKAPENAGALLIGNYTGISIYSPENGDLWELNEVNFPVRKLIYENPGVIWASHPYEGVYRIGLENDLKEHKFIRKIGNPNKKGNYRADVFKVNNQIAVLKDNTWFKYNSFTDSLEIFGDLKDYQNHRLLVEANNGYWFTNVNTNGLVYTDFKDLKLQLSFKELNGRLVKGNEKVIPFNDSIFYLTLNDGFARINLNDLVREKKNENLSEPIIYHFSGSGQSYDLTSIPTIPYTTAREVVIGVALPDSDASGLFYELQGRNGLKGKVENGEIKFQNLAYGDYILMVYALSPQGVSSNTSKIEFSVMPPWYLSNLVKFFYLLIFLFLIGMIYWFNRLKLKKHRRTLEQKYQKEHEERLYKIEKERLMGEINSKRKELANTTLLGARKNEVLMEIQGELSKDKDKFSNQFRLKHIMNKINREIKNKDEWNLFETNFNELHEDFFKDLLSTYPKLSNKDLKLCSYLKMNMSSKEIAPLMGITVRGVEVHRYRLRKKMKLDPKENLTNFFIKNF